MGKAKEVPVVLYHHLLPEKDIKKYNWNNNSSVISVELFKEHMNYLKENNFTSISNEELYDFIKGKKDLPDKSILIHFDDGYLSNTKYAYPILKEKSFKASIFIIGIKENLPYEDFNPKRLDSVNFSELDRYKDVFEYGSHTYDLHKLENSSLKLKTSSLEEMKSDFKKSKQLFNTDFIAYPLGFHNDTLLNAVEDTGYKAGFTLIKEKAKPGIDPYLIPRYSIYPDTNLEKFKSIVN